jgi:hypothetical protein
MQPTEMAEQISFFSHGVLNRTFSKHPVWRLFIKGKASFQRSGGLRNEVCSTGGGPAWVGENHLLQTDPANAGANLPSMASYACVVCHGFLQ